MTTLNLTKTPIGVPQELHSAFSDIYNALWALQAGQTEGSGNQVSLVQGIGISIRVDGNSYIISNSGIARVVTIGNGYELLAPASDAGTYNLLSLLAGDNIKMDLDKESGLTISAILEKVNWSAIVDAPATYPPEVHAHALTDVTLYRRGSSSFKSAADYFDFVESSCLVAGGAITLNSDCTVTVAAGTCLVRETADHSGHLYIYDFPAATLAAISAGTTKRIVVAQTTVVNGDGSVTRSVTAQLADATNESNTLTLAVVSNVNGTLHFIAQYPGAANLLRSIIARESAIAPVALEASSGFKLTTGVSRTLQVEAGATWAGMFRYPHALRDSAVKPITEVYGAHFGVTLSSWPNAKYYSAGADNLQDLAAGTYGCLWIYSSIDTDDWFVAYGTAQYATASLAASAYFPSYLTQQFKNTTFFLGRLIFLANADSPFDLETAQNFGVSGTVAKFADLVNSYASLVNGKVPESQLPSYVDDVLEFDDNTKFPATGERGKIYVDCLNNATYRWTGTTYVKIGDGSSSALASTDALPEGTVNKYYLDSRARAALSASGSLAYNPTTGVFSYTPPASEPPLAAGTSSQYYRGDKTWQTLNKEAVGLNNVDNTADANKSVSYAATAGSAPASDVSSWAKAATKPAYTAAEVGLGNVNNTSDADKPVSNATAAALSGKEPTIVAGTAAQYWAGNKSWTDFATSARAVVLTGLSTATNAVIVATDSVLAAFGKLQKQVSDNLTALITHTTSTSNPHGVTKAQVGLGNVDNTADINKPISTAMHTALDAKENNITAGATSQYYRGDKTWQTLNWGVLGYTPVNKAGDTMTGDLTVNGVLQINASAPGGDINGQATFGFSRSGTGSDQYLKIATLPASTASTRDHIVISGVFDDDWSAGNKSRFEITLGNRGAFAYRYHLFGSTKTCSVIKAYQETDGSVSVWAATIGISWSTINLNITHAVGGVSIYKDGIAGTPTGTLVFDSSLPGTYQPQLWISADGATFKNYGRDVLHSGNYNSYSPTLTGAGASGTWNITCLGVSKSVAGTNSATLVSAGMADNDAFRILVGGTASNAGYAEIATADDGTEPIYVRQYTGAFANCVRTLTLLNEGGDTQLPGNLYVTADGSSTERQIHLRNGNRDVYYYLSTLGESANVGLWDATAGRSRWDTDSVGNFTASGRVTAQGAFPQMKCVGTAGNSGAITITNDSGKTFCLGVGAYAGNDTYFNLYNVSTGSHPILIDQSDNATFVGVVRTGGPAGGPKFVGTKAGNNYSDGTAVFRAVIDNPNGAASFLFEGYCGGESGTRTHYVRADGLAYFANNISIDGNLYAQGSVALTAATFGNYAVSAQQAWQDITLPSYWTLNNAEDKPQYMKDSFGFVHMRGRVATSGNGTATLPAGYRPAAFTWIGGRSNTMPGYGGGIGSNGVINWIDSTTSYIIFDNVCFRAA